MIENTKKLIVFIFFLLILSACSSDDSSGPALVEISSDEENVDYEEEDVDEEDGDEEENDDMDITEFIPPELPDLPDPPLSSTEWNQVNGPFGGTITSIFKSLDGYWVTTTDNSCLLYTSPSPRDLSTSRMPSSA